MMWGWLGIGAVLLAAGVLLGYVIRRAAEKRRVFDRQISGYYDRLEQSIARHPAGKHRPGSH